MRVRCLVFYAFILFSSCNHQEEGKVAVKINDHVIYVQQVDSSIIQYLSDEMDAIYFARKMAVEKLTENYILENEAKKQGMTTAEYVNAYCKKKSPEARSKFNQKVGVTGAVPSIRNGKFQNVSVNSTAGQAAIEKSFLNSLRKQLIDSLKKVYDIDIYLGPPLKQTVNLENAMKEIKGDSSNSNVLTIISDYECSSCRKHYEFFKKLCLRFQNKLIIEKIYYSDEVHLAALAAIAAGKQNRSEAYERILYSAQYASDDTGFFVNAAKNLGMDSLRFRMDLLDSQTKKKLQSSIEYINKKGIRNTPTLLINHRLISNYSAESEVEAAVISELEEGNR